MLFTDSKTHWYWFRLYFYSLFFGHKYIWEYRKWSKGHQVKRIFVLVFGLDISFSCGLLFLSGLLGLGYVFSIIILDFIIFLPLKLDTSNHCHPSVNDPPSNRHCLETFLASPWCLREPDNFKSSYMQCQSWFIWLEILVSDVIRYKRASILCLYSLHFSRLTKEQNANKRYDTSIFITMSN